MNKLIVLVLATYFSFATCFASFEVYDFESKRYLTPEEFALQSNPSGFYILGEHHYNPYIQKTQSEIVELLVSHHQLRGRFDLGWEFMNFNDHESIQIDWNSLQNGNMSLDAFLAKYGQNNAGTYHPIFETLLANNGYFYGVNAPRTIKQQIIKGGLNSVDPKWIPPRMEVGGDDYLERFRKAMGGHVDEDMLKSYFLAQCYGDSVMAHHLNQLSENDLSFLVVGTFHSDYNDGTVVRLKALTNRDVFSLKIVDGNQLSDQELQELLRPHPVYGNIANFLVIAK